MRGLLANRCIDDHTVTNEQVQTIGVTFGSERHRRVDGWAKHPSRRCWVRAMFSASSCGIPTNSGRFGNDAVIFQSLPHESVSSIAWESRPRSTPLPLHQTDGSVGRSLPIRHLKGTGGRAAIRLLRAAIASVLTWLIPASFTGEGWHGIG